MAWEKKFNDYINRLPLGTARVVKSRSFNDYNSKNVRSANMVEKWKNPIRYKRIWGNHRQNQKQGNGTAVCG